MVDPVPPPANDQAGAGLPVLYQDPRPMDSAGLAGYGLRTGTSYRFAATANSLPITITEFQQVQKCYPILFGGDPPMAIAALGFSRGENLYVERDGTWADEGYIPVYVRRYPFVLAEMPGQDRMLLCVDAKAEVVTDRNPDLPFFVNGKPTDVVNTALEFCRRFQEEVNLTRAFCAELQKHGLLKPTELRFTLPDGKQQSAGSFISIDYAAFDALSDDVFIDFRKRGLLPHIYYQMASQSNWVRLNGRREKLLAAPNGRLKS